MCAAAFQAGHEGSILFARSRFPSSERCLMAATLGGLAAPSSGLGTDGIPSL